MVKFKKSVLKIQVILNLLVYLPL